MGLLTATVYCSSVAYRTKPEAYKMKIIPFIGCLSLAWYHSILFRSLAQISLSLVDIIIVL